ncbi:MAG: hypothetical protein AAB365_00555 [Patescibacteria group bacterium]
MKKYPITPIIGSMPHRIALAGGWIDQPFVSKLNTQPFGSMVVAQIEPDFLPMERSGLAGSTRSTAIKLWPDGLPWRPRESLVRELYVAENKGKSAPSGSQDMIGLLYPGINRLDYNYSSHRGVFPTNIASITDAAHAHWLEEVLHVLPIAPRPPGYDPLGIKHLDPEWIARLGQSGTDCFRAITEMDPRKLGRSFNECMECWETILPATIRHRTIKTDLKGILKTYQRHSLGAMYSGCGGGYLFVISEKSVPGSFKIKIRTKD